jgi:hypothetical protein
MIFFSFFPERKHNMEFGQERGWWERTGDRTYEKEEWRKIPTERFRYYFYMARGIVSQDMPPQQTEWLEPHVFQIPSYETYNPFATVLGFASLDWDTKQLSEKRLKRMVEKHAKAFQLSGADVLRYGRKWQDDWVHEK